MNVIFYHGFGTFIVVDEGVKSRVFDGRKKLRRLVEKKA